METIEQQQNKEPLEINGLIKSYLIESSGWMKFLAIMGFIGAAILLFAGFIFLFVEVPKELVGPFSEFGHIVGVIYLVMAILIYFPTNYMYNASKFLRQGSVQNSQPDIEAGFMNFKSYFKFMGIFTIVILVMYALMLLSGLLIGGLAWLSV